MSEWLDADPEDFALSDDEESLDINFEADDFGNRYLSIKIEDIISFLKKNKKI